MGSVPLGGYADSDLRGLIDLITTIDYTLHIFRAAIHATPLRDMLHESLQRVTPIAMVKIVAKQTAAVVADCSKFFLALQRVTPLLQQVSQWFGLKPLKACVTTKPLQAARRTLQ